MTTLSKPTVVEGSRDPIVEVLRATVVKGRSGLIAAQDAAEPCGSASTRTVGAMRPKLAARCTDVIVFPTPPFRLTTAIFTLRRRIHGAP